MTSIYHHFETLPVTRPDLEWFVPERLADFIEKEISRYFDQLHQEVARCGGTHYPGHTVALAVYSCIIRLDSWDQIEARFPLDASLQRLCGGTLPGQKFVRRSIAFYKPIIISILARSLEQAWRERFQEETCFTVRRHNPLASWPAEYKRTVRRHFTAEAASRLAAFTLSLHREL